MSLGKTALKRLGVVPALQLAAPAPQARWELSALAGRFAELTGSGATTSLTLAFALVLDAQKQGEPAAWITGTESSFFPPDAADGGVDLGALVVVRVPGIRQALRAADHLARSGAFGLLVLDLYGRPGVPSATQTRLAGLAFRHTALILCLTRKSARQPSLGPLVSLRAAGQRERTGPNRFSCRARVLKDKRGPPGWEHTELCRGPDGLR